MKTFKTSVRTKDGNVFDVQIQAKDAHEGRKLLEMQYGSEVEIHMLEEVR